MPKQFVPYLFHPQFVSFFVRHKQMTSMKYSIPCSNTTTLSPKTSTYLLTYYEKFFPQAAR